MKKLKYKLVRNFYPIVWSLLIIVAIFLLFRFTNIYLSDNVGQATNKISKTVMSKLCINMIESGSSLISFTNKVEAKNQSFPMRNMDNILAIHEYTKDHIIEVMPVQEVFAQTNRNAITFYDVSMGNLTKEYILTNGAFFTNQDRNKPNLDNNQIHVGFSDGELVFEESEERSNVSTETMIPTGGISYTIEQLRDVNFLINNLYIVDKSTRIVEDLFHADTLLEKDMTIKQENDAPQILIYHTHSQEAFADSTPNKQDDTVVGLGAYLAEILEKKYGYNVIHDKTTYDIVAGRLDRNVAYNVAKKAIEKTLEEYPSIEVIIDLHRDGASKRSTIINGEETAQIMLLNGLSRDQKGPITHLHNPYLKDNLAFSLQLKMRSLDLYPGLFYKNYLHCYRYNMHLRPKSILMELGTHENSINSARNSIEPFAKVLDAVLQGY